MDMNCQSKVKDLRKYTGMNRKEFCAYFDIPYRTVTEWERGNRHAPEYVMFLLDYYIRREGIHKTETGEIIHENNPAITEKMREEARQKKSIEDAIEKTGKTYEEIMEFLTGSASVAETPE